MKLEEIVVSNYGHEPRFPDFECKIKAFCVGGPEGVKAYFQHPDNSKWLCIASGDDGSWWLSDIIDKYWVKGMVMALQMFQEQS